MLVQLFTIWIFIGLTVKEIEPVFERLSVYEESIKRISVLDTDKLLPDKNKQRLMSLSTENVEDKSNSESVINVRDEENDVTGEFHVNKSDFPLIKSCNIEMVDVI